MLSRGRTVRVLAGFEPDTLRRVLSVLEEPCSPFGLERLPAHPTDPILEPAPFYWKREPEPTDTS